MLLFTISCFNGRFSLGYA